MDFATAVGWGWALVLALVSVRTALRARAWGARPVALLVVGLAAATVPVISAPQLPVRAERIRYAGPDLLDPTALERRAVADSSRAVGFARVRRDRIVQGATLLEERRRVTVPVPWLWAVVVSLVLGWRRFRTAAVLLVVAALPACTGETAPGRAELRLEEVMEMRRTGRIDDVGQVFLAEAVYEDVAAGAEYRGVPEIAGYLGWVHGWASAIFMDVIRVHGGSEVASAEWVVDGVQTGPVPGLVDSVTNRRFQLRGITVVEIERGAVVRAVDYVDLVPMLLDLGAEIRIPGGTILLRELPDTAGDAGGGA